MHCVSTRKIGYSREDSVCGHYTCSTFVQIFSILRRAINWLIDNRRMCSPRWSSVAYNWISVRYKLPIFSWPHSCIFKGFMSYNPLSGRTFIRWKNRPIISNFNTHRSRTKIPTFANINRHNVITFVCDYRPIAMKFGKLVKVYKGFNLVIK